MLSELPPGSRSKELFSKHLKDALDSLYDPRALGNSPLLDWFSQTTPFNPSASPDPVKTLRKMILDAIEALRPYEGVPRGTKSGRVYELLRQRFIEQQVQRKVAENIGMSTRQLQREEKLAVEMLSDTLWRTYHLQEAPPPPQPSNPSQEIPAQESAELRRLKQSTPSHLVGLSREIQDGLAIVKEALRSKNVTVDFQDTVFPKPAEKGLEPGRFSQTGLLYVPTAILRQGLLAILGTLITMAPGGKIFIQTEYVFSKTDGQVDEMRASFETWPHPDRAMAFDTAQNENLIYAASLITLCGGSLHTSSVPAGRRHPMGVSPTAQGVSPTGENFCVTLHFQVAAQSSILFVDDNSDALELYRRYLVDTPYRFFGALSAQSGVEIAEKISPQVIVLDVMMPEEDGWSCLNMLRMRQATQQIPVIVCSVLQLKNLALTLGASDFIHKPVSQPDLLASLKRQLENRTTTSG